MLLIGDFLCESSGRHCVSVCCGLHSAFWEPSTFHVLKRPQKHALKPCFTSIS